MPKILLVDDMIDLLEGEQELIESCGSDYEVKATASPEQALQLLNVIKFDLIILDLRMPKMDGLTFLEEMQKKHSIPVIIYSGYAHRYPVEDLLNRGAKMVLAKPAAPDLFLNAIRSIVEPRANSTIVIEDGYKFTVVNDSVLERRIQEALSTGHTSQNLAEKLSISQEFLFFLLSKFNLGI